MAFLPHLVTFLRASDGDDGDEMLQLILRIS